MRRALLALGLGFVGLVIAAVPATATTPADLQQQQAAIDQIRAQLGSNLADALAAQQQLQKSLHENAVQQEQVRSRIADAQAKISDLDGQIAAAQAHEALLQHRIDTERAQLRSLARAIYVEPGSLLVVLAESRSLSDLITRMADLSSAGSRAAKLKDRLNADLGDQRAERYKEQVARDEQVKLRDQLQADLAKLQDLQAKQEDAAARLQAKIEQTRAELYLLNRQSAALAQRITDMLEQQQEEIIAAAMQAVWDQVQMWNSNNSVGAIPPSPGHSTKYRFIWPEPDGQISQGYGPTTLWFEPPYAGFAHFHTGIDICDPYGSPILAADDGIVILVGSGTAGYGNYVVVAHAGGLDTLYGHLATAVVKAGQQVTQGQALGMEGSTGNSTGPHVHFELRINGKPVDPSPYLPPGAPSPFNA